MTAAPPDSIRLAADCSERAPRRYVKQSPQPTADCGDFAIWAILTALLGGTVLIPSSGDVLKTEVAIEDVVHLGGLTAQTEVDAMVLVDETDITIAIESHGRISRIAIGNLVALPSFGPAVGRGPTVGCVEDFPVDGDMAAALQVGGMVARGTSWHRLESHIDLATVGILGWDEEYLAIAVVVDGGCTAVVLLRGYRLCPTAVLALAGDDN